MTRPGLGWLTSGTSGLAGRDAYVVAPNLSAGHDGALARACMAAWVHGYARMAWVSGPRTRVEEDGHRLYARHGLWRVSQDVTWAKLAAAAAEQNASSRGGDDSGGGSSTGAVVGAAVGGEADGPGGAGGGELRCMRCTAC